MHRVLLIFGAVLAAVSANTVIDCPASVSRDRYLQVFKDSCFEFVLYRERNYNEAQSDCASRGGTLALVQSQDIQDFLIDQINNIYKYDSRVYIWIGLHDKVTEGTWVWEDGSALSFANWIDGDKPLQIFFPRGAEDCVVIHLGDGKWDDLPCEQGVVTSINPHYSYVCQYRIGAVASLSTTEAPATGISETPATSTTEAPSTATTATTTTTTTSTAATTPKSTRPPCPGFICTLDCGVNGYKMDAVTACAICECDDY